MPTLRISTGVVHTLPTDLRKALASDPKSPRSHGKTSPPLARNEWIFGPSPSRKRRRGANTSKRVCSQAQGRQAPVLLLARLSTSITMDPAPDPRGHFVVEKKGVHIMHWLWLVCYYFFGGAFYWRTPSLTSSPVYRGAPFKLPSPSLPAKVSPLQKSTLSGGFSTPPSPICSSRTSACFQWREITHVAAFGLGLLLKSLTSAHHFGQFHGGNAPARS